ncbi:CotO family spore coat protein [Cytobacillus purgationiresistens]|uniref:Spore coat protein CotO n=1 Tax=Cytobacillus purgationiresistens TaxID=863449 RepID=A0ABU0ABT5_9BACI|nr:CotO family spore coat protein [Cytobacillus purgationiresistens]MDQ0268712.1 hypothetical protein [Cytobacillus purgationiresistens]
MSVKNKMKPLLYIHQPELSLPQTSMQNSFSSKQSEVAENESKEKAAFFNQDDLEAIGLKSAVAEEESIVKKPFNQGDHETFGSNAEIAEESIVNKSSNQGDHETFESNAEIAEESIVNKSSNQGDHKAFGSNPEVAEGKSKEIASYNQDNLEAFGSKEEVQEVISEYINAPESSSQSSTEKLSFQRLKSFKEMNIPERVNYLSHFPKQLPPVPCLFETEEIQVRGFLVTSSDTEIEVRTLDGDVQKLNIQNVKSIRMIGFR